MRGRRLRVGLLSPWASRLGGGVFEAVVAQAGMIASAGAEPVVFALADQHSATDRARFTDTEVHLGRVLGPSQVGYSPELSRKLANADIDLLHLHGIWMATSHLAAAWAAATARPYVISPHGMLDPWITARGRAKKQVARIGYERRSWARATLLHALTDAEANDITRETGRSDIVVIPNAVDTAPTDIPINCDSIGDIVYLGRIHPKKNIDALIRAWCLLAARRDTAIPQLTIAGWGEEAHVAALRAQIAETADSRIAFVGPVFGENKRQLIADAALLSLPSHSEGLPMVILEAWAAGVPTAMSQHCNLPGGFDVGAAIDSGTEADTIAAALERLLDEDAAARAHRRNAARTLVKHRFSAPVVREQWMTTYDQLLRGTTLSGSRSQEVVA